MGKPNALTPEQRHEIANRYRDGAYPVDLALEFGVTAQTIKRCVKIAGIANRVGRKGILSLVQKEAAVSRYMAGESTVSIGKDFGVKPGAIASIVKVRGFPIRSHSDLCRRLPLNEHAFSEVSDDSAYWIGLLMADGCISKKATISLGLQRDDKAHIEKFRAFVGSGHKIGFSPPKPTSIISNGTGSYRIEFNSKKIADDLAKYGVTPKKSLRERVIALDDNKHFWRGMIDGDGYIGIRKENKAGKIYPTITLVGGREILIQFIVFLLRHTDNAKMPSIHRNKRTPSLYSVSVTGSRARQLISICYDNNDVALDRKKTTAMEILSMAPSPKSHDWTRYDPFTHRFLPKSADSQMMIDAALKE